jgi:hypothetical protein
VSIRKRGALLVPTSPKKLFDKVWLANQVRALSTLTLMGNAIVGDHEPTIALGSSRRLRINYWQDRPQGRKQQQQQQQQQQ